MLPWLLIMMVSTAWCDATSPQNSAAQDQSYNPSAAKPIPPRKKYAPAPVFPSELPDLEGAEAVDKTKYNGHWDEYPGGGGGEGR